MRSHRAPTGRSFSKLSKTNSAGVLGDSLAGTAHVRSLPERVRVGAIAGPHGLSGALRFVPDNPDLAGFGAFKRLLIESPGGCYEEHEVLDTALAGRKSLKLRLSGITTIAAAEARRGATVYAFQSDLPALGPGQFYYFAAAGCQVLTTDGRKVGTIAETFSNGEHDTWIVRDEKREYLVPVIADVVRSADFDLGRIVIVDLPGLLD